MWDFPAVERGERSLTGLHATVTQRAVHRTFGTTLGTLMLKSQVGSFQVECRNLYF